MIALRTKENLSFDMASCIASRRLSNTARFAYYTGQDRPENKKEFLKQSELSKSEYTLLNKKGIIKSFYYDDGCAHATLNLKKARLVLERTVCFHELSSIQDCLEKERAQVDELLDTFASMNTCW